MRSPKLIGGAAAAAAIAIAAGVAAAPRAWRRLRAGRGAEATWDDADAGFGSDFAVPEGAAYGDPEAPVDEAANAALRDELREKVGALAEEPVAEAPTPVEADLVVDGVPGADPAAEAARERLRRKAEAAKDAFRS